MFPGEPPGGVARPLGRGDKGVHPPEDRGDKGVNAGAGNCGPGFNGCPNLALEITN